ncbi:hypothetical protein QBC47DRAFT_394584 [Echria macrotheca]|uniref:C2H2-type domain-containing protein n=1 Tax=Echria macrotheca TaxID=438768 RepID=A0AAJ0B1Y6_9PEZI|nr:hypothetical protein QBC47DRAFT_394584 [Echria macrotheca]
MADFSILLDVLNLFPDVAAAVDGLKDAKFDRESRAIDRRLSGQLTIYSQFTYKLLRLTGAASPRDDGFRQKVEERLGMTTTDLIAAQLREMQRVLRELKRDLGNTRSGTEILNKFGSSGDAENSSVPKASQGLARRLGDLTRLNTVLASCLLEPKAPLAFLSEPGSAANIPTLFHEDQEKLLEAINFLASHTCTCPSPHPASLRCRCLRCNPEFGVVESWDHPWSFEVAIHPMLERSGVTAGDGTGDVEPEPLLSEHNEAVYVSWLTLDGTKAVADESQTICSALEEAGRSVPRSQHIGRPERSTRKFMTFDDLLRHRKLSLERHDRIVLAFRLCSAVLQFANTPFARGPWGPRQWLVAVNSGTKFQSPEVFLLPTPALGGTSPETTVRNVVSACQIASREPVLTALGLVLLQLVLGRNLADIRRQEPNFFKSEAFKVDDTELLDILTARRLLALRYLCQTIGPDIEDAVSACLTQQYRDGYDAKVKQLVIEDASFPRHAMHAVLAPLYREVRKNQGTFNSPTTSVTRRARADTKRGRGPDAIPVAESANQKLPSTPKGKPNRGSVPAPQQIGQGGDSPSTGQQTSQIIAGGDSTDPPRLSGDDDSRVELGSSVSGPKINVSDEDHSSKDVAPPLSAEGPRSSGGSSRPDSWVKPGTLPSSEENRPSSLESNRTERDDGDQPVIYSAPPSCGPETTSGLSYETVSESVDSSFAWLFFQPYKLPDGHPLLALVQDALRVVFRCFRQWVESPSGGHGRQPSQSGRSHTLSSRKRHRGAPGNGRDQEDEYDEEDDVSHHNPTSSRQRPAVKPGYNFACPFLKKDPSKYLSCCAYTLSRIRDVKQHLGRKHSMPIYCPRCIATFSDEIKRDTHVRQSNCTERPLHARPDGISEAQKTQLARRPPANSTAWEQWYGVFEILFPGHPTRPDSPYLEMDRVFVEGANSYSRFLEREGPRLLSDYLERQEAVTWNYDGRDLEGFQQSVFEQGFRFMFNEYFQRGQAASSTSDSHPTATTTTATTQPSSEIDYGTHSHGSPMNFQAPAASLADPGPSQHPNGGQIFSPSAGSSMDFELGTDSHRDAPYMSLFPGDNVLVPSQPALLFSEDLQAIWPQFSGQFSGDQDWCELRPPTRGSPS